eukprot:GHVR01030271.1.p1 GENE.GHVR01030271.1~~GHVR01030271.1.p1  ORF type:complete len:209 (+),score=15.34 GHVR01030271.1:560-1186(+)
MTDEQPGTHTQRNNEFQHDGHIGGDTASIIQKFISLMGDVKLETCGNCLRKCIGLKCQLKQMGRETVLMCYSCRMNSLTFSLANHTIPEADDEVPECLKGLKLLEEMLIARVSLLILITRLRGGGQYSYSAHCIAFAQDVQTLCDRLPRLPQNLDIVVVRKPGTYNNHRDFKVRRVKVLDALYWLKHHNDYYRNISGKSIFESIWMFL